MVRAVIFDYGGVIMRRLRLQKELVKYAQRLQRQGIKTAILSNMNRPAMLVFSRRHEFAVFDPVVISANVGSRKPNPEIYQLILEKLQLPANECVFIDNRPDNVAGADKLGMQTIHAKNTKQVIEELETLLGAR